MFSEEIKACLEQKVILLTQILNLTKQIEVRCNEPAVELEHFLDQRGSLMQRVDKCDDLMHSCIAQMPPVQQSRVTSILNQNIEEKDCSEEERSVLLLADQCNTLFQRAAALDQSANDALKKQYEDVKDKLKEIRKADKGQGMFSGFR